MILTVTRRGQAYCFVGGKKILSGMKAAANINITLSVLEIMGKNAEKLYDFKIMML